VAVDAGGAPTAFDSSCDVNITVVLGGRMLWNFSHAVIQIMEIG